MSTGTEASRTLRGTQSSGTRQASGRAAVPVACLLRDARAGDQAAWEAIVGRFSGLVWATVRGYRLPHADQVDAAQTTWLRLVEHLDRIREPDHLGAWLTTTARRESLRIIRQRARELPTGEADVFETPGEEPLEMRLLPAEREEAVRRAFALLPERSRRLLRLLFGGNELSYAEIAAAMDMPVGAIGPTRKRCLERLHANPDLIALIA